jgi:hypothetical protein
MALHVSASTMREELTELCHWIAYGHAVVVECAGRPAVLVRRHRRGDRGQRITSTRFRRELHRVLLIVHVEPVVVTADGDPYYWVGPAGADDLADSAQDRREWLEWTLARW